MSKWKADTISSIAIAVMLLALLVWGIYRGQSPDTPEQSVEDVVIINLDIPQGGDIDPDTMTWGMYRDLWNSVSRECGCWIELPTISGNSPTKFYLIALSEEKYAEYEKLKEVLK